MTGFRTSPIILEAISNVCKAPAMKVVAQLPTINHRQISRLLNHILVFLRENVNELGDREFMFMPKLDKETQENQRVSSNTILEALSIGENVLMVDSELTIMELDRISDLSLSGISTYSTENRCCLFYVHNGIEITIYANGRIVSEINASAPANDPLTHKKYARSAFNYEIAIKDHYKNRLRYGGAYSDHWAERKTRTLRNSPKKTEKMFHDNLQNYLDENLNGAMVLGNVKKITDDATDIEVRVYGQEGVFYIIEVKWLGTNGASSHSESRLRDGVSQIEQYLQRDPAVKEVCLVAYDARDMEQFIQLPSIDEMAGQWKQVGQCLEKKVPIRGKGYVFYLESKYASEK